MILPRTLTPEFIEAVDNLIQDATVLDSTLHSCAQQYLKVFNETNPVEDSPAWTERIHKSTQRRPLFTTPKLFNAMYEIADELGLIPGKRYVSAAICVCGEHAMREAGEQPVEQAAGLAQALHQLSATWVAFLLWPFYAHAQEDTDTTYSWAEDLPGFEGSDTPTPERIARAQAKARRRRCEEQVRERDDYRCFMTGVYDSKWCHRRPFPPNARFLNCGIASIIPFELWADEDAHLQNTVLGMLARFCGMDGTVLIEKASSGGPRNTLLVYVAATDAFSQLLWTLHPTEKPNCYEIKSYQPSWDEGCRHITSHVTFADHSASASAHPSLSDPDPESEPRAAGVDLPDRELLRAHAALAGILNRSGARHAFVLLQYGCRLDGVARPGVSGWAFWQSVVEYGGPEVCSEIEEEPRRESGPLSGKIEAR